MTDQPTNEKIAAMLEKIAKLLELATHPGTGEAEASSAAAMAQTLLQKYNLTVAEVAAVSGVQSVPIVMLTVRWNKGRTAGAGVLAKAVARGYFCQWLTSSYQVTFVGREHDAKIACYVFEQLDWRLNELALIAYKQYSTDFKNNHRGYSMRQWYGSEYQTKRLDYIQSFLTGAAWALFHRLDKSQKDFINSTALVVTADKAIKKVIDENSTGTYNPRFSRETNNAGYQAGAVAGKNVPINAGLPAPTNDAKKRLGGNQ